MSKFSIIDLCCGLGGLSLAAENLQMQPFLGIDTNKSALKTYKKNFPASFVLNESITKAATLSECLRRIAESKTPANKLIIVSGPPCQGFSMAGKRNPKDPRNNVLLAVAKYISTIKPAYAIVENVAFLMSGKYHKRVSKFVKTITTAGFYCAPICLDAQNYGVPQRRKRVLFLISQTPLNSEKIESKLKTMQKPSISVKEGLAGLPRPKIRPDFYSDESDSGPVHNHYAMQHSDKVIAKISRIKPGKGPLSYRRLHPDKPASTLLSGHRAPPAHHASPRSITIREAARLQGFPDSFRIYGNFGAQMEQVTNAVPPPLAEIALRLLTGEEQTYG